VSYGADVRSVPFADAIYSWNRAIVALSLARDADPVTDHPFAWAFVERIRTVAADAADDDRGGAGDGPRQDGHDVEHLHAGARRLGPGGDRPGRRELFRIVQSSEGTSALIH